MNTRCDRCGAVAKTEALLPSGGVLYFCKYHAIRHRAKLIELGARVA